MKQRLIVLRHATERKVSDGADCLAPVYNNTIGEFGHWLDAVRVRSIFLPLHFLGAILAPKSFRIHR